MPRFKYTGRDRDGREVQSVLTAEDERELYQRLKDSGIMMLSAEQTKDDSAQKPLPTLVLLDFCSQIGTMLKSGIALLRALEILIAQPELKPKYRLVYTRIAGDLREGLALSEALRNQGEAFPEILISMAASAETSGSLDLTLIKMAQYYDKQNKLKKRVSSALTYPKILTVVGVVALAFIVAYVVPQFDVIFDMLDELPLPTKIVLNVSEAVKNYWYIFIMVFASLWIICGALKKLPSVRLALDKIVLKLPLAGKLVSTIYTARFANTLSSLYAAGIPITTALQAARHTVGNVYIDGQFDALIDEIRAGGTLSDTIRKVDGFDVKLSSIIRIGEESGKLDEMLTSISERLDFEADAAIGKLVALLEPAMIVLMAVVIGFIMVAVVLPMVQFYGALEQYSY